MPLIPDAPTGRNTTHPIELEADVRTRLRAYRRFLRATRPGRRNSEDHIVNSSLRYIFENDDDFTAWLGKNPDALLDRPAGEEARPKPARPAAVPAASPAAPAAAAGARQ